MAPARTATPRPQAERKPVTPRNSTAAAGTHRGLEMKMIGPKKTRLVTPVAIVRPVRMSRMKPEIKRVQNPTNCDELGA